VRELAGVAKRAVVLRYEKRKLCFNRLEATHVANVSANVIQAHSANMPIIDDGVIYKEQGYIEDGAVEERLPTRSASSYFCSQVQHI
jgi:hypothetical protein